MTDVDRRTLLRAGGATALALATGAWSSIGALPEADALAIMGVAPVLPTGITPYLEAYQNWSGEIQTESLWTCTVTGATQVVALANWAKANGWRLRPRGYRHNWSPLTVANGTTSDTKVLLVDTRSGLSTLSVSSGSPASVTVGAGVTLERLLGVLDGYGLGMTAHPAVGQITIGGALAIGGHGTAVPAAGETKASGHTWGSMSNLVIALKAVVWDAAAGAYVLKSFSRSDPAIAPLLVHLGRAFITEVTLRVGRTKQLRCQSTFGVSMAELCAPPGSSGRTVSSYLNSTGRLEIIWFPFTTRPWLKVWSSVGWFPPLGSLPVWGPYSYTFADQGTGIFAIPLPLPDVIADPTQTPSLTSSMASLSELGLGLTWTGDIYGSAKDVMLYVRPSTVKMTENGVAILCRRADVQRVVSEFYTKHSALLEAYRSRGLYPVNGPVDLRVTGVDNPADCGVAGAVDPILSSTRRRPDHPEWDTVVWIGWLGMPGTPGAAGYYDEMETWLHATFNGTWSTCRVEWSKGWAYTPAGAYTDPAVIDSYIPSVYSAGQPAGAQFADAVARLDALDPHHIYSSPLLDQLL